MNIGIAGYGTVGGALHRLFRRGARNTVTVYDKYVGGYDTPSALARLDRCDVVFLAVPTPYDPVRGACDLSNVDELARRVSAPLCIKSTVPPGTTDALIARTGKRIAFSPEYLGERLGHPWTEADDSGFLICGGDPVASGLVRDAYASASSGLRFVETSARAAELVKYMENAFLATKVSFVNQFFDLAASAGVDFAQLRELFLLDARVGASHTEVFAERGFGGRCLPKDMSAIVAWSAEHGADASFLRGVLAYNDALRERSGAGDYRSSVSVERVAARTAPSENGSAVRANETQPAA